MEKEERGRHNLFGAIHRKGKGLEGGGDKGHLNRKLEYLSPSGAVIYIFFKLLEQLICREEREVVDWRSQRERCGI